MINEHFSLSKKLTLITKIPFYAVFDNYVDAQKPF